MSSSHSPLAQFEIRPLISLPPVAGLDLSLTNSALFMFLAAAAAFSLLWFGMGRRTVIPGRMQVFVEILHNAVANLVEQTAGPKSKPFFPYVFALFLFILFCNMMGLLPHGFTVTSHIVVTMALALSVFFTVTITGFVKHGWHFFSFFLPHGTPWYIAPLMFALEVVSFCIRPFSHATRLFANMLAGGILLKVFAGMVAGMVIAGLYGDMAQQQEPQLLQVFLAPLPLILTILLTGFKLFVAGLQAYIFTILAAVYLHDALEMH